MLQGWFTGSSSAVEYVPLHTPTEAKKRSPTRIALILLSIIGLACLCFVALPFLTRQYQHRQLFKGAKLHSNGYYYPPSDQSLTKNAASRQKAAFVVLVRNRELVQMKSSMRHLESRFNRKFNYPWIFLNNEPFTEEFKRSVRAMTNAEVKFGLVPKEHWGYPEWISQEKAAAERNSGADYRYIESESYRHMCRYQSGFFYRHPLILNLDYYWRVEPGVEFWCDIEYDPFVFMALNKKVYGFTMALEESPQSVRTLFNTTKEFIKQHPKSIHPEAAINFITDNTNTSQIFDSEWNMCHFWSNFEIASLRFWRSKVYMKFFEYLDKAGGFFYERWGDAPVHTLAVSLFANKSDIHFFNDIGYKHEVWGHCPKDPVLRMRGRCECDPDQKSDMKSCAEQWKRINN